MMTICARSNFRQRSLWTLNGRDRWQRALAFEARNVREAQELCKESWFYGDLTCLKSGGVPLYTAQSKLSVRPATAKEAAIFSQASDVAKPSDDMVLAYLAELDDG